MNQYLEIEKIAYRLKNVEKVTFINRKQVEDLEIVNYHYDRTCIGIVFSFDKACQLLNMLVNKFDVNVFELVNINETDSSDCYFIMVKNYSLRSKGHGSLRSLKMTVSKFRYSNEETLGIEDFNETLELYAQESN